MIYRFKLPKLSANIAQATVTAWLKNEGDTVRKGEPLVELTTDKAVVEVEAPRGGTLRRCLAAPKRTLPVGYILALIGDDHSPLPDVSAVNRRLLHKQRETVAGPRTGGRDAATRGATRVRATPAARRLARELGLDLAAVARAGARDRRLDESDVRAYAAGKTQRKRGKP
jgi:pyruvate dehydrogenase E2 component (dihydrolipoamide acetyltransferase)